MEEDKISNYKQAIPSDDKHPSRYLFGAYVENVSWIPFITAGIVLAAIVAFALSYNFLFSKTYVVAGLFGLVLFILILRRPELGGYLLIASVFTNISNILTDKGLPGINQPLVGLTAISILANYILRTGKYQKFPALTRTEWALIAYFSAIVASAFQYTDRTQAFSPILDVTKDILVGVCLFLLFDTKEKWETGMWILIIVISILSVLGVYKMVTGTSQTFFNLAQLSIYGQVDQSGNLRFAGAEGESNIWAQVLIAAFPLIVYRFVRDSRPLVKVLLAFSAIFTFLAMVYTGSRGAFIGFVVVGILMILELHIKPLQIFVGIFVMAFLLTILPASYSQRFQTLDLFFAPASQYSLYQDDSFVSREAAMLTGLAMFQANPILGVGFGNYGNNYWQYAGDLGLASAATSLDPVTSLPEAHSLYVEVVSETGILGILTFSAFFGFLLSNLWRIRKRYLTVAKDPDWSSWVTSLIMAILAFLVSGLFLHGIQFRYIWMLVGMGLAAIYISNNAANTSPGVPNGRAK